MTRFTNIYDFVGTYLGNYDGRQAELIIAPGGAQNFYITLRDIDRQEFYETNPAVDVSGMQHSHVLSNLVLQKSDERSRMIHWRSLYIHTWNTDYVSGVSVYNNAEYGMSFTRIHDR